MSQCSLPWWAGRHMIHWGEFARGWFLSFAVWFWWLLVHWENSPGTTPSFGVGPNVAFRTSFRMGFGPWQNDVESVSGSRRLSRGQPWALRCLLLRSMRFAVRPQSVLAFPSRAREARNPVRPALGFPVGPSCQTLSVPQVKWPFFLNPQSPRWFPDHGSQKLSVECEGPGNRCFCDFISWPSDGLLYV